MNWKEIFKVSAIVAVVLVVLILIVSWIGPVPTLETQLDIGLLVGALMATYSVLDRRLKKEEWGVAIGILATTVFYVILILLLDIVGI